MKKILALLLVLSLILVGVCACSGDASDIIDEPIEVDVSQAFEADDLTETSGGSEIIFLESGVTADGCTVSGSVVTITKSGNYTVSGACSDGQIIINAKNCAVNLALNGLNLTNKTGAAIFVQKADKVVITVCADTENVLSDTSSYTLNEDEEPTATIFSKSDLTINGSGKLTVNANYNNAIQSKDVLKIVDAELVVNSVDDGIIGKDMLMIKNAKITLATEGDGLRSTNDSDTTLGIIKIESGEFYLVCGTDGIQASNAIVISGGVFDIKTGGGSANSSSGSQTNPWGSWGTTSDSASAKGIKATNTIIISGGTFNLNTSDDSLHSNGSMQISGGAFIISSGDDGAHADSVLEISGGTITVTKSYEGLEALAIKISGGTISVKASDDGLNAAGGNDQSSFGRPGANLFSSTSGATINISGGSIYVNAGGDGVDSNGSIVMSGGSLIVEGPTDNGNGALDYDSTFTMSGGELLCIGSSGMAQMTSQSSSQNCVMIGLGSATNVAIKICDNSGAVICEYTPTKQYSNIVYSSASLTKGTYSLYLGGTAYTQFTVSSTLTTAGNATQGGMGGGMPGGNMPPNRG